MTMQRTDPQADGERAGRADNRKARLELNQAQDEAAATLAGLLKILGEYQDGFARDLHPTWPEIGSANLIIEYLQNAVRHVKSMPAKKGVGW